MKTRTRTRWKNITKYDSGLSLTTPTLRNVAVDFGLKFAGAAVCYGLGALVGEAMDHITYVNYFIPDAVHYVSKINVEGNLDGLFGLLGLIYGGKNSGIKISEKDPDKIERVTLSPVSIGY